MITPLHSIKFGAYEGNLQKRPDTFEEALGGALDYFDGYYPLPPEHKVGIARNEYGGWLYVTNVPQDSRDPKGEAFDKYKDTVDFIDLTEAYHGRKAGKEGYRFVDHYKAKHSTHPASETQPEGIVQENALIRLLKTLRFPGFGK